MKNFDKYIIRHKREQIEKGLTKEYTNKGHKKYDPMCWTERFFEGLKDHMCLNGFKRPEGSSFIYMGIEHFTSVK